MTIVGQFGVEGVYREIVLPEVLCFDRVGYSIDHQLFIDTNLNYGKVREIKFVNVSSKCGHVESAIELAKHVLGKAQNL